jgi:hypothetical protein
MIKKGQNFSCQSPFNQGTKWPLLTVKTRGKISHAAIHLKKWIRFKDKDEWNVDNETGLSTNGEKIDYKDGK